MPRNLSRRAFASALTTLPIFQRIAHAGENWSGDYKEWSDKQIEKMLGDSPWSHKVAIAMGSGGGGGGRGGRRGGGGGDSSGGEGMGGGGGLASGGMSAPGGGGRGGGASGMEGAEGGMPQVTATVRWASALPVQQAVARKAKRELRAAPPAEYAIGVFGLRGLGRGPGGSRDAAFNADELKQRLKGLTTLKIKGRAPLNPTSIDIGSAEGASAAIFHFSNEEPITLEVKEVEFSTQFGSMEVRTRFKPKDMVYDGKLAV